MSSEFTFGDNSHKLGIFQIFMNLVDRDLTEYQITQSLTLSRLHTQLEQTRRIRLFTHTQHVDRSRQKGIRLFNHPLEQTGNPSFNLPFNAVRVWFEPIRGKSSWSESMVDEKYEQNMLRLLVFVVYAVCTWKPEQIVDIPVPQIMEEIAEVSKSLIVCNSILNLYFEEIEVFRA